MIKNILLILILLFPLFNLAQGDNKEIIPQTGQEELKQVILDMYLKKGDVVIVYTQFKVDANGKICDISTRGTHKIFEEEAFRILKEMPEITSEKIRGKASGTKFTLPLKFRINDKKGEIRLHFLH
jgi:hypothetical protein